jgi:hypothetical protein
MMLKLSSTMKLGGFFNHLLILFCKSCHSITMLKTLFQQLIFSSFSSIFSKSFPILFSSGPALAAEENPIHI